MNTRKPGRQTQDWSLGAQVKVGFLTLIVKDKIATPRDYKPDAYFLTNIAETNFYRFVPHFGLTKLTQAEFNARDIT